MSIKLKLQPSEKSYFNMPVDSQEPHSYSDLAENLRNDNKSEECTFLHCEEISNPPECVNSLTDGYIIAQDTGTSENVMNEYELEKQNVLESHLASVRPKVLSDDNLVHQKHSKQPEFYQWRRVIGVVISGNELKNAIMPRKFCHKLRFAQAKRKLSQLCSYFSVKISDCDEAMNIVIGVTRKDFPSATELGVGIGSVGYYSETGRILSSSEYVSAHSFYKGDVIGCGIVFPARYKRYVDLSPDDSSDGMTDVVLSSLLNVNKKSMDFVQHVLGLKLHENGDSSDEDDAFLEGCRDNHETKKSVMDDYNENYVESRRGVEVYFTLNMTIVGKISTCVPVGGFYPTIQILSPGSFTLQFDDAASL